MPDKPQEQQSQLKKQRATFTQVPNGLIESKIISAKAKAIYCYLYSKPESWVFFMGNIYDKMKEGRDAIRAAIRELEKHGYLKRYQAREGNKFSGQIIEIYTVPYSVMESHEVTENQSTETQHTENAAYSNTNQSNTDNDKKKIIKEKNAKIGLAEWEAINGQLKTEMVADWVAEKELAIFLVDRELDNFRDKSLQHGYKYSDFKAAFRNWIKNEQYGKGINYYKKMGGKREETGPPPQASFASIISTTNNL